MDDTVNVVEPNVNKNEVDWGYSLGRFMGSLLTRKTDLTGYDTSLYALLEYKNQLVNTFYKTLQAYKSELVINDFKQRNKNNKLIDVDSWEAIVLRPFVRDTLGYPSIYHQVRYIPTGQKNDNGDEIYKKVDFDYGYKNRFYGLLTDQRIKEKWNKFTKKHKLFEGLTIDEDNHGVIQRLATAEARYEMVTLLASTKFMSTNALGGKVNEYLAVGMLPVNNAHRMYFGTSTSAELYHQYGFRLKPNEGKQDIENLFIESGMYYSFLKHEFGLVKDFNTGRGNRFANEILQHVEAGVS